MMGGGGYGHQPMMGGGYGQPGMMGGGGYGQPMYAQQPMQQQSRFGGGRMGGGGGRMGGGGMGAGGMAMGAGAGCEWERVGTGGRNALSNAAAHLVVSAWWNGADEWHRQHARQCIRGRLPRRRGECIESVRALPHAHPTIIPPAQGDDGGGGGDDGGGGD